MGNYQYSKPAICYSGRAGCAFQVQKEVTARQVVGLYEYLRLLPAAQEKLFIGNIRNAVFMIVNELKGINPAIQNAAHIRGSVILNWLRKHNKRQVQYMIGHKYITSTEHYEQQELTKLISQLEKYHPLG